MQLIPLVAGQHICNQQQLAKYLFLLFVIILPSAAQSRPNFVETYDTIAHNYFCVRVGLTTYTDQDFRPPKYSGDYIVRMSKGGLDSLDINTYIAFNLIMLDLDKSENFCFSSNPQDIICRFPIFMPEAFKEKYIRKKRSFGRVIP